MRPVPSRPYRRRVALVAVVCAVAAAFPVRAAITGADQGSSANGNLQQELAVPAYIDPTADPAAWTQLDDSTPGTVGIVVANVNNGPDSAARADWAAAIQAAHNAGEKVLGYVDTGYLGSPIANQPGGLLTRSGLTGLSAWLPQIESDVNAWYSFYGPDIDGIFFDEGTNTCGPTAASTQYSDQYAALTSYVKQAHPGATTALNPGTAVPQCYEYSVDTLVTFEGSYGDYTGNPVSPAEAYQPLSWSSTDPFKFWHIIYGALSQSQMEQVMALSKSRNAGYVYVTNDVPANPYDTLPAAAYWSDEIDESYPFGNPGSSPPTPPGSLTVNGQALGGRFGGSNRYQVTSSTSAQLSWQPSTGVSAPVVAYDVYQGSTKLGSVDANTLSFTVNGLAPSSTEQFSVAARDQAGNESNQSGSVQVTTAAADTVLPWAPPNLTVTSTGFTTATLSWSAPATPGQSLAGYSVTQDGVPVLTVGPGVTTASMEGLQPGLATYTFAVSAIGSTGNTSPPSNEVVATTQPLPDDVGIDSPSVQVNPDGSLTYGADYATPFAFRRVFIATGAAGVPCWDTGNASPICADYLLENGQLLQYAGSGTDFEWNTVEAVAPVLTGVDFYSWTIPGSLIGSPATQTDLFEGDGYSPETYTDLVGVGGPPTSVTSPYTPAQAPALAQQVVGLVTQALSVPPTGVLASAPATGDPLCPATPTDTWNLNRSDGCMSGSYTVTRSLVDGLLPGSFTLGVTDDVNPAASGRTWTETVTVVLQPVSGTVPYYQATLTPTCSDGCGPVAPVTTTLQPGQPFTTVFQWSDPSTATDLVNVSTQVSLAPELPTLNLPFAFTSQTASLGWSTPVLRCDSVRGASSAGCVFPQSAPTWSGLSQSSHSVGQFAQAVAADQQAEPQHWGVQGQGSPLAYTANQSLVQANQSAGCIGYYQFFWLRSYCDQYPFASTYQGASQSTGAQLVFAPPNQISAAESALSNWEAAQHVLDGDQYWVQVGP